MLRWQSRLVGHTRTARKENKMNLEVPAADVEQIEKAIASEDSVVGIDAKKTHVLILYKLLEIERRLKRVEGRLGRVERVSDPFNEIRD